MVMTLLVLSSAAVAVAGFMPNVRIDHQNQSNYTCCKCAITIGPGAQPNQPLYVAFQGDTLPGGRSDIWFQKSTDAGRTWLAEDLLIRRGDRYAVYPDITTDSDGNVYVVYKDVYIDTVGARNYQVSCVRSSDGGATWTAPARVDDSSNGAIGWARIAADSAGNLFCAWNQLPGGISHVFSSVSTDKGATWSPQVRVDNDTTTAGVYHADVFVQPGTNHYLVAATVPLWVGGYIKRGAYLYRSTDRGLTFQPGVQLDTFNWNTCESHVVADRDHIICDYFGPSRNARDRMLVEARTFYTQADTWGAPSSVTELDTLHSLYYSGKLALSADGRVHTALMICHTGEWLSDVYYTSSSDHGVSWSDLELVNDDTSGNSGYLDIGTDVAGHAYVVWMAASERREIWFSTNNPAGIAEQAQQPCTTWPIATVVRNVLFLPGAIGPKPQAPSCLLDISGREVLVLKPGENDVRALAPGVYFVREAQAHAQAHAVRKVVVTR